MAMNKKTLILALALAIIGSILINNASAEPLITLTLLNPAGDVSVNQNEGFEVKAQVQCSGGDCGQIDTSLYQDGNVVSTANGATPFFANTSNPESLTLNNSDSGEVTWFVNASGAEGDYNFSVNATQVSNQSVTASTSVWKVTIHGAVVLDTTPPVITINSPTDGQVFTSTPISANLSLDENGTVSYILNGGANTSIGGDIVFSTSLSNVVDGTNAITFYATDAAGNTASKNVTFNFTAAPPPPPAPSPPANNGGGSSGGGGGDSGGRIGPPPNPQVTTSASGITYSWSNLSKGLANITINSASIPVSAINLLVLADTNNVKLTVSNLGKAVTSVDSPTNYNVFTYIEIKPENFPASAYAGASIYFTADSKWLKDNNIDEVTLLRNVAGQWVALPTQKDKSANSYVATTPGFSVFAIAGKKTSAPTTNNGNQKAELEPQQTAQNSSNSLTGKLIQYIPVNQPISPILFWVIVAVVIGGIVVGYLMVTREKDKEEISGNFKEGRKF
ncbi:MAG: PGF-pre-PGF domain-containing protein [Nanoarchaeota archaeon]|nr:MAG: PGF-pre-PGF domain-containing protein [Nanoarchaeota archaeon]